MYFSLNFSVITVVIVW